MMIWIFAVLVIVAATWLGAGYSAGGDPLWFLSGQKVYLIDWRGEVHVGRVRTDRNGVRWSYVHPMTRVGRVVLLPDGAIATDLDIDIRRWTSVLPPKLRRPTIEERNAATMARAS